MYMGHHVIFILRFIEGGLWFANYKAFAMDAKMAESKLNNNHHKPRQCISTWSIFATDHCNVDISVMDDNSCIPNVCHSIDLVKTAGLVNAVDHSAFTHSFTSIFSILLLMVFLPF